MPNLCDAIMVFRNVEVMLFEYFPTVNKMMMNEMSMVIQEDDEKKSFHRDKITF